MKLASFPHISRTLLFLLEDQAASSLYFTLSGFLGLSPDYTQSLPPTSLQHPVLYCVGLTGNHRPTLTQSNGFQKIVQKVLGWFRVGNGLQLQVPEALTLLVPFLPQGDCWAFSFWDLNRLRYSSFSFSECMGASSSL